LDKSKKGASQKRRLKVITNIYPIPLGLDQCYVIQEEGAIMIDGGTPGQAGNFKKAVQNIPLDPTQIKLILITHGHWDHIGSAKDIQEITGAKIAMHHLEKDWLEQGTSLEMPPPPGVTAWGRILIKLLEPLLPKAPIPAADVEIVLGDEPFPLTDYGIPGRVLYTPGHSYGSVSLLLDSGDAFVGDLAMNQFPMCLGPGFPVFAQDMPKVKESWRLVLDAGAETIYPGHGKPFPAAVMRKALK
jgi:glyoxylase-like metal-dependent hydrolase (beta-lactamase superfamily II)